jgi:hydroxyquinol 1,2-dioxygenase
MREYTPDNITDAVIEQMSTTPDPRLKEVMEAAVRHLHAFAREVKLTPQEWMTGIEFMTKVGQMCNPARQEFILLSDTVGLSALVNIMHDKTKMEDATGASLLGPFYRENTPVFDSGAQIANKTDGKEIVYYGRVTNAKGEPIPNALVTVWQTAADGNYDIQNGLEVIDCRGIFRTNANGDYLVRSVRPLGYFIPLDGPVGKMVLAQKRHGKRPAHIHFLISAPGYRELVTALYIAGDEHLDDEPGARDGGRQEGRPCRRRSLPVHQARRGPVHRLIHQPSPGDARRRREEEGRLSGRPVPQVGLPHAAAGAAAARRVTNEERGANSE